MRQSLNRIKIVYVLMAAALLLALAAAAAEYRLGDIVGWLFESSPTILIISVMMIWFLIAWVARRTLAGSLTGKKFRGRAVVSFVLFRLGLVYGSILLLVAWLVSAIAKLFVAAIFIQAAILLMMAATVTGIMGGAVVNTVVAVQRCRSRVSH